jgi:hypothetical protein
LSRLKKKLGQNGEILKENEEWTGKCLGEFCFVYLDHFVKLCICQQSFFYGFLKKLIILIFNFEIFVTCT